MNICYLSLGSNLHHPRRQLMRAITTLRNLKHSHLLAVSHFYSSMAIGPKGQPVFCNAVVKIATRLTPHALLKLCQQIEKQQLRLRKKKWGPRTLDIDLLLYGNIIIDDSVLTIPHPELRHRDFVLVPLLEIWPEAKDPWGEPLYFKNTRCPA